MQCQACRKSSAVTENGTDDPTQPYRLCDDCNFRIEARALRPLEWFNLASIHGPNKHLLHDDFYDDNGNALQPEFDVDDATSHPAPSLDDVTSDLERLLDFAITQWFLADDVVTAIGKHPPDLVLKSVVARTEQSTNVWAESTCYQICARSLGGKAEHWIRSRFGRTPNVLDSWVEAAAACLPFDEGWSLTLKALAESGNIREDAQALGWFRTEHALDWIEWSFPTLGLPVTEDWGRLAAISQLSWERVDSWLPFGRPLSLVALDALVACFHYNTLNLKRIQPKLVSNASTEEIIGVLDRYAHSDDVPRVSRAVATIKSQLASILGNAP